MSWWRKFRHGDADPTAAQNAVRDAEKSVERANARHNEVHRLVTSLEAQGQRNHFIERLNLHVRGS